MHNKVKNEDEIVCEVYHHLKRHGKKVAMYVPFLSRCIDLVLQEEGKIISIEFKLHDWKRGIEQAKHHLLGVDESYICLPEREPSKTLIDTSKQNRIGLLLYVENKQNPLQVEIQPKFSHQKWIVAQKWLKKAFNQSLQGEENEESQSLDKIRYTQRPKIYC